MPITRNRYQEGSIDRIKRAKGPDVWVFRWRESLPDGRRVQKKKTIGSVKRFKTESDAKKAVETLRAEVNAQQELLGVMTFRELWGDFAAKELRGEAADRSETTISLYETNAKTHLLPKWGDLPITKIVAVDVEAWLRGLSLAPSTKAKLRNQMSALYSHAIRHQLWTQLNPISSVRQSAKRLKTPVILSLSEMQTILSRIESQPVRVAILIAAVTGLRRSEIRGLKWGDLDFDGLWIRTKRGKIGKVESRMKTEASRKPTPIPGELGQALSAWREQALYRADTDWVFASEANGGREPMWFDILLKRHIRVAAEGAGIIKNIGWHTFRRSLATLLAAKKEDVKVVQELMRHANSKITIELYQQGNEDAKRNAQTHVTGLFELKKPAA
jgi:integrase